MESTETAVSATSRGRTGDGTPAYVTVAHDCSAPMTPAARFLLHEIDKVVVGRADTRHAERSLVGDRRRLALFLADDWVSRGHARLVNRRTHWQLEDLGSKNGTRLHGEAITSKQLHDGDVFVVGRTFFVFREARPTEASDPLTEIDAIAPSEGELGDLHTFAGPLAARFHQLRRVAPTTVSVLITGETGTGKEVLARAIHRESKRSGPLMAVNCGALPAALIEAELFGVKKGAFTGATEDRLGLVRAAADGTLFLDEIGELPLESQAVLLRVLEEREVLPIGATKPVPVDFRMLSATNCNLEEMVEAGKFRRDLLARIRAFPVHLWPLRDRREDLGFLLAASLRRAAPEKASTLTLERELAEWMFAHPWSGNVRELVQLAATLCAVAQGRELRLSDVPDSGGPLDTIESSIPASDSFEVEAEPAVAPDDTQRQQLATLLRRHRGNTASVARELGTSRSQVRRLAERYGLDLDTFRQ